MSKKLMSIIVLNWNRLHYSKQTIECVIKKTTVPHNLVLVDNNSTEESGVRDYLTGITKSNTNAENVFHVFNGKNLGVAAGRNSGIFKIESSGVESSYIFNIDDDILLPDKFDIMLEEICDKVPRSGIVGVSVEPTKYQIVEMNGVKVQLKRQGNINGVAICMTKKLHSIIGFYGFGKGTLYGMEDSYLRYKMDILNLLNCYIVPRGIHLDKDLDKKYRLAKNNAHKKASIQLRELSKSVLEMRKTGNIYTPYIPEEQYHPVDENIFTSELIVGDRK